MYLNELQMMMHDMKLETKYAMNELRKSRVRGMGVEDAVEEPMIRWIERQQSLNEKIIETLHEIEAGLSEKLEFT